MDIDLIGADDVTSSPRMQDFMGQQRHSARHWPTRSGDTHVNFLGINTDALRGKAFKEEEKQVAEYEKDVKSGKFSSLFPLTKASDCAAAQLVMDQIDTELNTLRRRSQAAKAAFRARWDKLYSQLQDHRSKYERAQDSLKCSEVAAAKDKATQQQDLRDALAVAAATKGLVSQQNTSYLPIILAGVGGIAVIGLFAYMIMKKPSAPLPAKV